RAVQTRRGRHDQLRVHDQRHDDVDQTVDRGDSVEQDRPEGADVRVHVSRGQLRHRAPADRRACARKEPVVEPAADKEVDAMRTTILCAAVVTLGLLVCGATVSAHHAFSSEFDANRHVVFTGTVSKMMWVNPHAWIYVDVKKPDGTSEEWMVEAGTPNTLLR